MPPAASQARPARGRLIGCRCCLRVVLPRLSLVLRGVGLFFSLGREEAMAALASLGALALLLLSSLSCCSGSGLAGAPFWRASFPRLVVRGGGGVRAKQGSGPSSSERQVASGRGDRLASGQAAGETARDSFRLLPRGRAPEPALCARFPAPARKVTHVPVSPPELPVPEGGGGGRTRAKLCRAVRSE